MTTIPSENTTVRLSAKVYRVLLRAYPAAFREEYGAHMLQVFQDYSVRTYEQSGIQGILTLWPITLLDFFKSVIEEHLDKETFMTNEKYIRFSGWSLMAGGVVMMIAFGFGGLYETPFGRTSVYEIGQAILWSLVMLTFGLGLFGLRARYRSQMGQLGNAGVLIGGVASTISFVGMFLSPLIAEDAGWFFFFFGILLISSGIGIFGIQAVRKPVLPRWNWVPLASGALIPLLLILQGVLSIFVDAADIIESLFMIAVLGLSIGTFILGFLLQGDREASTAAA